MGQSAGGAVNAQWGGERVDSDCCTVFSVPEIPKATETHDRSRFTVNACGEYGIGSTACRLIALSHACETADAPIAHVCATGLAL